MVFNRVYNCAERLEYYCTLEYVKFPKISTLVGKVHGIVLRYYDFKPCLQDDLLSADLVITHCGAGSVLECLHMKKRSICVINSNLLDNHQVELADFLEESGFIKVARRPSDLTDVIKNIDVQSPLKIYPEPDQNLFIDEVRKLIKLK